MSDGDERPTIRLRRNFEETYRLDTSEVDESYEEHSPSDIDERLEAATTAFESWKRRSLADRERLLAAAGEVLRENAHEYAQMMTRETGKPITQTEAEVEKCAWVCDHYAEYAGAYLEPDHHSSPPGTTVKTVYEPLGPVLAVMPWNFPFWQVFRFAAPYLTAGNICLLKYASNVPRCALAIEDVFREAGYPEGVFQLLLIPSEDVADVVADDRMTGATLTRSESAGRAVAATAGKHLKKTVLELGRSDLYIVLDDANVSAAAPTEAWARNQNGGQSCIDAKRFIIVDGINQVRISREAESMYLIRYQGHLSDYGLITDNWIREFGESYLNNKRGIPDWYIADIDDDLDAIPWLVPNSYNPDQTVECNRRATAVSRPEPVTPGRTDGEVINWFCPDCWDDVHNRWSPEWAHSRRTDIHRAEYLHRAVRDNPEIADIDEIVELIQSDNKKTQTYALTALSQLISERIEEIVSIQPILTDQLKSNAVVVQLCALRCLAMIAEHDPESALPVIDEVIPLLDISSDDTILEESIRFVAAASKEYPFSVRKSAANLVALLQEDPPEKQKLIKTLIEISKSEPEAVASEVPELITYVSNEDAEHRAGVVAVIGYVAKETPEATKTTVSVMSDLLDVSTDWVRANAVGVLADLSKVYPEELFSDLDRIINLVEDDNEYVQQNATYALAQIAEQYPSEVEPAADVLIDSLEVDSEDTRTSACQALGYTGATSAVEPLEQRRDEDPSMDVQQVAGWALGQISE